MVVTILPEGASNPPPVGHIEEGWLEADNVVTTDPVFLERAESLDTELDVGLLCQEAFTLGVAVWRYAGERREMTNLADQITRFQTGVAETTERAIDELAKEIDRVVEPEGGLISEAVSREMGRFEEAISSAFDENDKESALSRIEAVVKDLTTEMVAQTARSVAQLLDPGSDESPLGKLRGGIVREINGSMQGLTTSLGQVQSWLETEAAVAEEREKGTAKGRTFEEKVSAVLSDIAASTGDDVQTTGDETGHLEGSKVGDIVTTVHLGLPAPTRLVFECKSRRLSHKKATEELDVAVENRDAEVGLVVFSSQEKAPVAGPLVRLAPNRYSVVFDPDSGDDLALRVAYQLARSDLFASASMEATADVDVALIGQKVKEARVLLDQVTQIKSGMTKARNGLDRAEDAVVAMKTSLLQALTDIEQAL